MTVKGFALFLFTFLCSTYIVQHCLLGPISFAQDFEKKILVVPDEAHMVGPITTYQA